MFTYNTNHSIIGYLRHSIAFVLLAAGITLWAQPTTTQPFNLGIIPTPQQVELTGQGVCPIKEACQKTYSLFNPTPEDGTPDNPSRTVKKAMKKGRYPVWYLQVDSIEGAVNQEQAYRIEIQPRQIIVQITNKKGDYNKSQTLTEFLQINNETGLYCACRTLAKIAKMNDTIPCMIITDYPAFAHRAWQDDVSRGPVTNMNFSFRMAEKFEDLNLDEISLYTEHTLFNEAYPDLCSPSNEAPKTWALSKVILIANLQCFGHFEKTLSNPFYWHLKDSPTNLDPSNEEVYALLQKQIDNTKKQYEAESHYFFNINCDETEALGSGRASLYVNTVGAEEAYCKHINRVYQMVKDDKNDVMMWGDIVAQHPEMIAQLPKDMILICWNYSPSTDFSDFIHPYTEAQKRHGNPFWVAPSTCHYSSIHASTENYINNIAYMARDGYRYGASGILTTTWDDSGLDLLSDSYHALAWAAEMSWNPIKETDPDKAAAELKQREAQFNANYCRWIESLFDRTEEGFNPKTTWKLTWKNNSLYLTPFTQFLQDKSHPGRVTELIYSVSHLASHPMVGDWYRTAALEKPLLEFYPSTVDPAARQRADSVLHMVHDLCHRFGYSTLEEQSKEYTQAYHLFSHEPTPYITYIYALHRLEATALKARLRCDLYDQLASPTPDRAQRCREEMTHMVEVLHTLESEYLALWDNENGEYSRHLVIERFNRMAAEILEADRHVFVTQSIAETTPSTPKGKAFRGLVVSLKTLFGQYPIYYTLDGRQPSQGATLYKGPFPVDHSCEMKCVCYNQWNEPVYQSQYILYHQGIGQQCRLGTPYSTYREVYSGGGDNALNDGQLGSDNDYADGHWQGYWGEDVNATFDWGGKRRVNSVSMRFFQHTFDWILAPRSLAVYSSDDGEHWQMVKEVSPRTDPRNTAPHVVTYTVQDLNINARYLNVRALNAGPLPDFHAAHGQPSYIFTDEIIVE